MGLKLITARGLTRAAWAAVALLAAAVATDTVLLWRAHQVNAQIASGTLPPDAPGQPPELRFAQAHAQAASGALEPALNRYRALQQDGAVGQAARYNAANLLVRQALEVQATSQPGQAIALLELAKESYRELLRRDPGDWDARYNLERAQRLLPDPEAAEETAAEGPRERERAATTMRAYSPGLP